MSVSISDILAHAGYTLDNREDCEWLLSRETEWQELTEQAEEWLDDKPCEHEDTDIETVDNTEDYELSQAQGGGIVPYHKYDQEFCNDCGATRRLPEGEWIDE